jgi:DNA-binding PadR family transcriptional regulator
VRLTFASVSVAKALLSPSEPQLWARDIGRRTGLKSGTVQPILERMLEAKWVKAPPAITGKPRYYQVTELGRRELEEFLVRAEEDPRFTVLFRGER